MKYLPGIFATWAALSLTMTGCSKGDADKAATEEADETTIVDIDVAHTQSVAQTRSYTANVEADNVNNIAPSMANRIKSITVDVGDPVARGQVLVRLDAATADQQRISLENTELEYNRAVELLKIGAGTQRNVDQLKAQLDAARTQYRNTMDNTVLTSPITGVVTARNYDPGDMTGAQPVLTVGQVKPNVKVVINVNESDLASVRKGMPVGIHFDAFPGETFAGTITRISPAVDVTSRTFAAEVTVANRDGRLLPGMFARAEIDLGSRNNVVVPDRAVVKQSGSAKKFVYVYKNGTVEYREVQLGRRIDNAYELLEGLADGDTVVITGQSRLRDGAPARIKNK